MEDYVRLEVITVVQSAMQNATGTAYPPQTIVMLKNADGNNIIMIWVSEPDGESIVSELMHFVHERPMAHDLLKNVFASLSDGVRKVVINRLEDHIYYSTIHAERGGQAFEFDSRPSDAIAIALRTNCPIFIMKEIFDAVRHEMSSKEIADIVAMHKAAEERLKDGLRGPDSSETEKRVEIAMKNFKPDPNKNPD